MKAALIILSLLVLACEAAHAADAPRPNIVFVLCDNLGNGDVGCFNPGCKNRTPHLDRMAAEGMRLTSYYSASGVCTPSRAALMTGCYPRRVNMHVSDKNGLVLQPVAAKGLNPNETTIAEVLKGAGYATMIIGKWHLGDQPEFLPTRQGFDRFFGLPYSDDMTRDKKPDLWPELPLMRDEKVIEAPADRDSLTKRMTEEAIGFIEAHQAKPFFLYLPQAMPGSTTDPFASPAFKDKSANGHWGDSIEELDWSMGQILSALKRLGLDEKTLVIWTSDNGAPQRNPPQGSNAPYKGWGYNTSEGAMRMPCIARWPGKVPPKSECKELCTMMDILPTAAALAGAALPNQKIDGHDIRPLLFGEPGAASPTDAGGFFYYHMRQLQAVRSGPWKLYLPLSAKLAGGVKRVAAPLELYQVVEDVGETNEVSAKHPEIVERLLRLAEQARADLGDENHDGSGQRPAGEVKDPTPRLKDA
jgi:arylsulfatase A-like enzyme